MNNQVRPRRSRRLYEPTSNPQFGTPARVELRPTRGYPIPIGASRNSWGGKSRRAKMSPEARRDGDLLGGPHPWDRRGDPGPEGPDQAPTRGVSREPGIVGPVRRGPRAFPSVESREGPSCFRSGRPGWMPARTKCERVSGRDGGPVAGSTTGPAPGSSPIDPLGRGGRDATSRCRGALRAGGDHATRRHRRHRPLMRGAYPSGARDGLIPPEWRDQPESVIRSRGPSNPGPGKPCGIASRPA